MKLYSLKRILGSFILPSSAHIYIVCLSAWNEISYELDGEKYLYWLMYLKNLVWIWLDETEKGLASCLEDELCYIMFNVKQELDNVKKKLYMEEN